MEEVVGKCRRTARLGKVLMLDFEDLDFGRHIVVDGGSTAVVTGGNQSMPGDFWTKQIRSKSSWFSPWSRMDLQRSLIFACAP
jgi:hypothetical protein